MLSRVRCPRIRATEYEAIIIIHRMSIQHLCVFSRLRILSLSTTVIISIMYYTGYNAAAAATFFRRDAIAANATIYAIVICDI